MRQPWLRGYLFKSSGTGYFEEPTAKNLYAVYHRVRSNVLHFAIGKILTFRSGWHVVDRTHKDVPVNGLSTSIMSLARPNTVLPGHIICRSCSSIRPHQIAGNRQVDQHHRLAHQRRYVLPDLQAVCRRIARDGRNQSSDGLSCRA